MLFILDENNKFHRILRRGLIIGIFTFVAYFLQAVLALIPPWAIPLVTALLAIIDKATRELSKKTE